MIGLLRGLVAAQEEGQLTIDVGGVGYEVAISSPSSRELDRMGPEVTLYVHTQVKEDAILLFGFVHQEERQAFRLLLSISGIGPRTALALLSGLTVNELAQAVIEGDIPRLSAIPGIGKKTAERLTFELRDKIHRVADSRSAEGPVGGLRADLVSALVNLGYKPVTVERAVAALSERLTSGADFDNLLREGLRMLGRF
jgi:Holliday junction DNA helicase RuvA